MFPSSTTKVINQHTSIKPDNTTITATKETLANVTHTFPVGRGFLLTGSASRPAAAAALLEPAGGGGPEEGVGGGGGEVVFLYWL